MSLICYRNIKNSVFVTVICKFHFASHDLYLCVPGIFVFSEILVEECHRHDEEAKREARRIKASSISKLPHFLPLRISEKELLTQINVQVQCTFIQLHMVETCFHVNLL